MSDRRRRSVSTITSGLLGTVLGVLVGVSIPGQGAKRPSLHANRRESPPPIEATLVEPATASAASVSSAPLEIARVEVDSQTATAALDEIVALRQRIAELEAEVARLEQRLRHGDPRQPYLDEFFAANDLRHEELWRDLFGLLSEAENVVAEPQERAFPLLIRLVDETGLAAAPLEGSTRNLQPEPDAEGTSLLLDCEDNEYHEVGTSNRWRSTQLQLEAVVTIPTLPEGWLGGPATLELRSMFERGTNGSLVFQFSVESDRSGSLRTSVDWQPGACYVQRAPWRGGDERLELAPDALPALRAAVERFFDQLETRAR